MTHWPTPLQVPLVTVAPAPVEQFVQFPPSVPHAPMLVLQVPCGVQQPFGQLAVVHAHWPPTHVCPAAHTCPQVPQLFWSLSVPLEHAQPPLMHDSLEKHAVHRFPSVPQLPLFCWFVPACRHVFELLQQPDGQVLESHVHEPPTHSVAELQM
jgi:hypothetical protein